MPTETYLRHVDGLRAVAVLSVILYHFSVPYTPGGYIGVDVFFVISGFLITRLIYSELRETGRFDFARFYIRRMRRLFPALFVTLAATFCFAALVLSPSLFDQFGSSLAAAVVSVSNILFWSQSGYFDADSHLKPLLHTWSLSVEEQFYLVWPAFLWLVMGCLRAGRSALIGALVVIGIISMALNYIWVMGAFDADFRYTIFFLTPFRVFEFVIGGLGIFLLEATLNRIVLQEALMVAGLGAIGYAVVTYSEQLIFPYWYALLPSIGALMVIVSSQSRIAGRLLTNRAAVGIGVISYSLYLTHWPIISFFTYVHIDPPSTIQWWFLFVATFAAAIMLYYFVETPFRQNAPSRSNRLPQKAFVLGSLGSMLVVMGLGLTVAAQDGWAWRQPEALDARHIQEGRTKRFSLISGSACSIVTLDDPARCRMDRAWQMLVIGNSHEPDGYNMFDAIYSGNPDVNIISFGSLNNCEPRIEADRVVSRVSWRQCDKRVSQLADRAFVQSLDAIVIAANRQFADNQQGMWDILAQMQRINPKLALVVIGSYLNTKLDCAELFNRTFSFEICRDPQFVKWMPFGERTTKDTKKSDQHGLRYLYIDKAKLLCPDGTLASCKVEANGEPFTYDQHHLSFGFARFVGQRIAETYGGKLEQLKFPRISRRIQRPTVTGSN